MQRITWYLLLAVGVLVAPIAGRAQAPKAQAPQAKVREIATIPDVDVGAAERMPNGRVVIYTVGDSIMAYDLSAKRSTLITGRFDGEFNISRNGDRIAFSHRSEGNSFIWSIPIDPKTGIAAGPAQRVSLSAGDTPSLSPDGKLIAFALYTRSGNALAVVPATGGAEHILAKYDIGIFGAPWSDDGKWIFALVGRQPTSFIERVPAAGGRSEKAFSYAGVGEGTINGQIAFYRPDLRARSEGRIAYVTTSGAHGEFRISPGAEAASTSLRIGSVQSLLTHVSRPSTARIISLADGKARDLLPGNAQSRWPVWSPDGRRIALQDSTSGQYQITVMNADGSQLRRYPGTLDPTGAFMLWSGDGQMLAYNAGAGIAVLDVATGGTRIVSSAGPFMWRSDGKSLMVLKSVPVGDPRRTLYEVRLDGTERKLRDIPAGVSARAFISDQLVIVGTDSEQFVIPTSGGPARKLPGGTSHRYPRPGVSPGPSSEAKWILWLVQNGDQPITSVELMTAGGDLLRTLNLPFEVDRQTFYDSFRPDAEHVILVGKTPGESVSKIFLVPINGDAPRVLTQFSGRLSARFDVSPDGKNLVYSLEGAPTSKIYELDVSPILS